MTPIELIKQCRYFGNEKECPFSTEKLQTYWRIERAYFLRRGEIGLDLKGYYEKIGGKKYPKGPEPLLLALFSYWSKGTYDPKAYLDKFYEFVDESIDIAEHEWRG